MANDGRDGYRFKIGMRLMELGLDSFDDMLTIAQDVGVESVWFNRLPGVDRMAALSDAEWDQIADQVARYGLKISVISPEIPFKQLHLTELALENPQDHPVYRQHLDDLVRTMQVAAPAGHRRGQSPLFCLARRILGGQAHVADALAHRRRRHRRH